MTRLLQVQGLGVTINGQKILHGIDLELSTGELVTIVGPNGSGKTTLLRCLIGALQPDHGTITRMSGLRIGYVPQRLHLDPSMPMPVRRFLQLPRRQPKAEMRRVLSLTGADALFDHPMAGLSGGQTQRVLLARALLDSPHALFLDEPTQGLDQPGSANFYRLLETVARDAGCAVLMVSHELHVVMSASDRVICLNGHICCSGTPQAVSSAPEYRRLFGHGTQGALALYRHEHDHGHADDHHCAE